MTQTAKLAFGLVLCALLALSLKYWPVGPGKTSIAFQEAPDEGVGRGAPPKMESVPESSVSGPTADRRLEVSESSPQPPLAHSTELVGSLHDHRTGEAIFDFALGGEILRNGTWMALSKVRSDVLGKFSFGMLELDTPATRDIRLSLIDEHSVRRQSSHERVTLPRVSSEDAFVLPARLEVAVGPTIGFEVQFPDGLATQHFSVHYRSSPLEPDRAHVRRTACNLRAPLDFGPHTGRPWVRFGEPITTRDRVWVEIRSIEAGWRGGAWLTELEGVVAKPLKIHFERATRLKGRFTWPADQTFAGIGLRLARLRNGQPIGDPLHGYAEEDGSFVFEYIDPGPHRLWTCEAGWRPFELDVEAIAGDNDIGMHALIPRRVVGAVRGILRSKSGRFDGACHVSLADRPLSHEAPFDQSIDFELVDENDEQSERIAIFEFEDVTEGEWWLYVHCHDGYEFPGSVMRVSAPLEGIEVVLDDPALAVRIEIVEADSQQPCADAYLQWSCGEASDAGTGSSWLIEGLPDAPDRFQWLAIAPGRRAVRGTGLTFVRMVAQDGGSELVGRIELERGFGRRVVTSVRGDGTRLEGVAVLCDGQRVGLTGTDGTFDLFHESTPARITFAKAGWVHISNNDFNARDGSYSHEAELQACFEPEHP